VFNTGRVDHIYEDPHVADRRSILHYGDLTDTTNLMRIVQEVQPDEIYNLGAQSHVAVSFESRNTPPTSTRWARCGCWRRSACWAWRRRPASTRPRRRSCTAWCRRPQKETTPFYPRSPYAVAKLYAYWITVNYREAYGMYACNGILFNHESPRGARPSSRARSPARWPSIAQGLSDCLYMGNIDALRDWGHARTTCACSG
jgi:GDPmannose 4,6-dehydratase